MLDLQKFRELNIQRATFGFRTYKNVDITYWTTALAGEVGELCNMIKKISRVEHGGADGGSSYTAESITKEMIQEEIGGILIYLDLLASLKDIDLEEALVETFNAKSVKYGYKEILELDHSVVMPILLKDKCAYNLYHDALTLSFYNAFNDKNPYSHPSTLDSIKVTAGEAATNFLNQLKNP